MAQFTFTFVFVFVFVFFFILKKKNMDIWFFQYLISLFNRPNVKKTKHIMFCFVDHYEPQWLNPSREIEDARVDEWFQRYPKVASNHKDADGCYPKHTFFYPEEEYRKEHLDKIADLCARGYGEIEVHLHHNNDTSENLTKTLLDYTEMLHSEHGAFTRNIETGKLNYSFIHGNWTLCNSHPKGEWCGVNDELIILKETGCYADFTYPAAPDPAQTSTVNTIYYASDKPGLAKSHDKGVDVQVGIEASGDLMIIQGPIGLNWKRLKKRIFPQIENSDIRNSMPPSNDRVDLWIKTGIHVKAKPDWLFIKIHTHGTQEKSMDCSLGKAFDDMCMYLETEYNDGKDYCLHYVSAREMYNIIKAAEAGKDGNPNNFRNYKLASPQYKVNNV
ncbi:MAG: hypothetical protein QM504_04860 [Pseudomonadota bacterium]